MHDFSESARGLSVAATVAPVAGAPQQVSALEQLAEVERLIGSMLASWQDPDQVVQMRRFHRLPFRRALLLTAIDEQTGKPIGAPIPVRGRDISNGGLAFEHDDPLTCRKAMLTLPDGDGRSESLVVRLTWCRFTRGGTYQSGGPFERTMRRTASRMCETADLRST